MEWGGVCSLGSKVVTCFVGAEARLVFRECFARLEFRSFSIVRFIDGGYVFWASGLVWSTCSDLTWCFSRPGLSGEKPVARTRIEGR